MTRASLVAAGLVLLTAPHITEAAVIVAEPTGDTGSEFLAELKASLETVVADVAPALDAELRSSAMPTESGVLLVLEIVPAGGTETTRTERIASSASVLAQSRAMARELLASSAPVPTPQPPFVESVQLASPLPPRPKDPIRFRLESTAFAGMFWIGDVIKPTGGVDFGLGWVFAGHVGVGARLAVSWVELSYSCTDGECAAVEDDYDPESPKYWEEPSDEVVDRRIMTTLLTLGFDLSLGNLELFYADVLAGTRFGFSKVDSNEIALPLGYFALGLNLTPARHKRIALIARIDVGYYLYAGFYYPPEGRWRGLEPHGAVGVQF